MHYIPQILPALLPSLCAALIAFLPRCLLCPYRTPRRALPAMLLLFWFLLLIYITLLHEFGNGLGDRINLFPFSHLRLAARLGLSQRDMLWQLFLNLLMFVPAGLLLPLAFPRAQKAFFTFSTVFLTSAGIELLQLLPGRNADIDDVLMNTLGGIWGYFLYFLLEKRIKNDRIK